MASLEPNIRYRALSSYSELNALVRKVKAGEYAVMDEAARRLAAIVPSGSVLVPVPSHTGLPGIVATMCHLMVRHNPTLTVCGALRTTPHVSRYLFKKRYGNNSLQTLPFFCSEQPGSNFIVVDDVIATGATAMAVAEALGVSSCRFLAIADDDTIEKREGVFAEWD